MPDVMEFDAATSKLQRLERISHKPTGEQHPKHGWTTGFGDDDTEWGSVSAPDPASLPTYRRGGFHQSRSRPILQDSKETDDLMVSILDRPSGIGYAPSGKPVVATRYRVLDYRLQSLLGVMMETEALLRQGWATDVADTLDDAGGTHNDRADIPDEVEGIIEFLKSLGLVSISNRLEYLHREISEDPDEFPMSADSLGKFAGFVRDNPLPGSPSVWVDTYGYVGLEWRIPDPDRSEVLSASETAPRDDDHLWGKGDGILAMVFLPSGLVKFSGTSGPVGQGLERLMIGGTFPQAAVMSAVQPFLSRLVA